MIIESSTEMCRCCWRVRLDDRIFEIAADNYNDRIEIAANKFKRISGKSFRFNRSNITRLKQELAKQIVPECGKGCPLLSDDFENI